MVEGVRVKCRVCKRADKNLRNLVPSPLCGPLTVGNNADIHFLLHILGTKNCISFYSSHYMVTNRLVTFGCRTRKQSIPLPRE